MPRANKILLLFFFSCFLFSKQQAQELKFKHITIDDGLSVGYVTCILQDSKEFMWFGTQDGLNKYDGYEIEKYKYNPVDTNSLSNNHINYLFEDSRNILWIATKGGLNALNLLSDKLTCYKHDSEDSLSLFDDNVFYVTEDQNGIIWIGTLRGLNSFDPKNGKIKRYEFSGESESEDHNILMEYGVKAIYTEDSGMIWMGTYGGGLCSFDPASGTFKDYQIKGNEIEKLYGKYHLPKNKLAERVDNAQAIRSICPVGKEQLWIATDAGGITIFNKKTGSYEAVLLRSQNAIKGLGGEKVLSLAKGRKGVIWIGTYGEGVTEYRQEDQTFLHHQHNESEVGSILNNDVSYVYEDRRGVLWVASIEGISVYFPTINKFKYYHKKENSSNTLLSDKVMAICEDKEGLLWIGTMGGGLSTFDRNINQFKHYPKFSISRTNSILSVLEDAEGIMWVGTYGGGLVRYDKQKESYQVYDVENSGLTSGTVTCLLEDNDSILWVGTYGRVGGLFELNKRTGAFTQFTTNNGMSTNSVYSLKKDVNGDLWIGTVGGGINKRDHRTGKFTVFKNEGENNTLSSNTVNCIYQAIDSTLWIGTTIGLNHFDPKKGSFNNYYEKDGLPNDYIYGILGDKEGELWLSTNRGISKFNPNIENKGGQAFRNYDENYGIQGKEFNQGAYFLSASGEMFFGGVNGFNAFYPKEVVDNQYLPPVYISSFVLNGKEMQLDTVITNKNYIELSWLQDAFSIGFVGLDYQLSNKIKYTYVLEGLTTEWSIPSTKRYADYTELSGGDYVFKVKVANNNGVWNDEAAVLYIHIEPPFWETLWFKILMIVLTIIGVIAFVRYRTHSIKKENELLEAKVVERTLELAEKNRDITSSIQYAKRIQEAMLPSEQQILKYFPESFILYLPKDIVSGDFYWFGEKNGKKIIAAVDCTGHGVPGAFMSMIGHNLFSQIVMEKGINDASEILNELNKGVQKALKQGGDVNTETNDGMDVALCSIQGNELEYAGAYRPLIVIRKGEVIKVDGNKFPIGGTQLNEERVFTKKKLAMQSGDIVYLFSDGYADQFGGTRGKKFMLKRFHQLLSEIQGQKMKEQEEILIAKILEWKGSHDQVDDILVIGIRF